MIVHVNRTYATDRKGITFGLRTYEYCGGRLTGAVAQAANFVTEQCRKVNWKLSVSDVLSFWIQGVMSISHEDRVASEKAHQKKRPSLPIRKYGRWKARRISDSCSYSNSRETGDKSTDEMAKPETITSDPSSDEKTKSGIKTDGVFSNTEKVPPHTPPPEEGTSEVSMEGQDKETEPPQLTD